MCGSFSFDKVAGLYTAIYSEIDSSTDFLHVNFQKHLFCRTTVNGCFWRHQLKLIKYTLQEILHILTIALR